MDWERLPVAPLYADVPAYCSHVKMYCKRACLLSSYPRLFIHSFIHHKNDRRRARRMYITSQFKWDFKSRLSLIVPVNVVLNRTVVVDSDWRFDNLCSSHLQSQSELYHASWWYYTLVIDLIGQLRRDVIGRLSINNNSPIQDYVQLDDQT